MYSQTWLPTVPIFRIDASQAFGLGQFSNIISKYGLRPVRSINPHFPIILSNSSVQGSPSGHPLPFCPTILLCPSSSCSLSPCPLEILWIQNKLTYFLIRATKYSFYLLALMENCFPLRRLPFLLPPWCPTGLIILSEPWDRIHPVLEVSIQF